RGVGAHLDHRYGAHERARHGRAIAGTPLRISSRTGETSMGTQDRIRSRNRGHTDRKIEEVVHDPYHERYKPPEPAFCPRCGAIFHSGRWEWGEKAAGAHEHLCPACRRIREHYPAGYVTLSGSFRAQHAAEISGLISNEAAKAQAEHPLERII